MYAHLCGILVLENSMRSLFFISQNNEIIVEIFYDAPVDFNVKVSVAEKK